MFWKILALVLVILLTLETVYTFAHRSQANRFQPLKDEEGIISLDTTTGRLCRTTPMLPPKTEHEDSMIFLARTLPACWDIR